MTSLARIRRQLDEIRALTRKPDAQLQAVAPGVSGWSTAEHLDHILKVSSAIVGRVREENPPAAARGISLLGRAILACGWIPRGRGRAPERLAGKPATAAELEAALEKLEHAVGQVVPDMLARRAPIVPHPKFGGLTPAQGLRFVAVHNDHHLKIVSEILRARR